MSKLEKLKLALQVAGVFLLFAGLACMPIGYGISPKRDVSPFNNIADTGAFVRVGLGLIGAGVLVLAGAWLVPIP